MATFNWHGKKVMEETEKKAREALHRMGEGILTEANKTVPHDEGTLERSGFVASEEEGDIKTYIAYDTPYAARQHEDTTLSHRGTGRAKWLQLTVQEMANKLEDFLAKEMK